jgi:DNA invertase Pin-like site-specific DNA recombinase
VIPAYIYAAKSTEDTHDSIPDQITDARGIADAAGWTVIGDPFVDEAFSAYSGPRGPALADVMTAAAAGAREHGEARIIVQRSDRVARGDGRTAPHLVEYVLRGRREGFLFVSKLDPQTFGPEGLVYAALGGDQGHSDSKLKGGSVSRGMARRARRGLHNGGPEKYGYRTVRDEHNRPDPGPRQIVPAEAGVVRRIFADAERGIGLKQITRDLNAEGVPTKTGRPWWQGVISRILHNPYYIGFVDAGDGDLIPGQHQPIIARDQFDRVQAVLSARRIGGDGGPGRTSSKPALFTHGHLRCGCCGSGMGIRRKPQKRADGTEYVWERYICSAREQGASVCAMRPIPADALEAMMLDQLKAWPRQMAGRVRDAVAAILTARDSTVDQLAAAEREVASLRAQHERTERDYRAGDLPARLYGDLIATIEDETAAAVAQVEQLAARAEQLTTSLGGGELDAAVQRVMARISEIISDTARIETARNLIRQAWPTITAHRDGDEVWLEVGDVSDGFLQAVTSANDSLGLPMVSFAE